MQVGWSVEGLERIQRHAEELLPRLFPLQADCYEAAAPSTLQPVSLTALELMMCTKSVSMCSRLSCWICVAVDIPW